MSIFLRRKTLYKYGWFIKGRFMFSDMMYMYDTDLGSAMLGGCGGYGMGYGYGYPGMVNPYALNSLSNSYLGAPAINSQPNMDVFLSRHKKDNTAEVLLAGGTIAAVGALLVAALLKKSGNATKILRNATSEAHSASHIAPVHTPSSASAASAAPASAPSTPATTIFTRTPAPVVRPATPAPGHTTPLATPVTGKLPVAPVHTTPPAPARPASTAPAAAAPVVPASAAPTTPAPAKKGIIRRVAGAPLKAIEFGSEAIAWGSGKAVNGLHWAVSKNYRAECKLAKGVDDSTRSAHIADKPTPAASTAPVASSKPVTPTPVPASAAKSAAMPISESAVKTIVPTAQNAREMAIEAKELYEQGLHYLQYGKVDKAIDSLKRADAAGFVAAKASLGFVFEDKGNITEAVRYFINDIEARDPGAYLIVRHLRDICDNPSLVKEIDPEVLQKAKSVISANATPAPAALTAPVVPSKPVTPTPAASPAPATAAKPTGDVPVTAKINIGSEDAAKMEAAANTNKPTVSVAEAPKGETLSKLTGDALERAEMEGTFVQAENLLPNVREILSNTPNVCEIRLKSEESPVTGRTMRWFRMLNSEGWRIKEVRVNCKDEIENVF